MACSQLRKAFKIIYLYVFILVLKINNLESGGYSLPELQSLLVTEPEPEERSLGMHSRVWGCSSFPMWDGLSSMISQDNEAGKGVYLHCFPVHDVVVLVTALGMFLHQQEMGMRTSYKKALWGLLLIIFIITFYIVIGFCFFQSAFLNFIHSLIHPATSSCVLCALSLHRHCFI